MSSALAQSMSAVDTSREAVDRLAADMAQDVGGAMWRGICQRSYAEEDAAALFAAGLINDKLRDTAATLRALRAERDAARAEVARLREALSNASEIIAALAEPTP